MESRLFWRLWRASSKLGRTATPEAVLTTPPAGSRAGSGCRASSRLCRLRPRITHVLCFIRANTSVCYKIKHTVHINIAIKQVSQVAADEVTGVVSDEVSDQSAIRSGIRSGIG